MRKQRLVVLAAALLAVVVLALLWGPIRDELQIEGLRRRALADRHKLDADRPWDLHQSWRAMADEGDAGFFALARLLEHEDSLIWAQALVVIDEYFARDDYADLVTARRGSIRDTPSVLAALRERSPFAYLRYLTISSYKHGTEWRWGGSLNCNGDGDCSVDIDIPTNERSLRFCEDVLLDRVEYLDGTVFRDMHLAAVHGLCGMLSPGKIPDRNSRSVEAGALDALETYVARGSNLPVRLHAVKEYLRRIGREQAASPVLFEDWLALARLGWPGRSHEPRGTELSLDESFFQPKSDDFRDPRELAALVRVHDPIVLRILIRLDRQDPSFGKRLDEAVAAEVPGFGPPPAWRPFEDEARRWLDGTIPQRAAAALALVDLGGEASRRSISSELAGEVDPDLRSLLVSCLAALGDHERLEACRTDFEARLAGSLQELGNREVRYSDDRIREYPGWGLHDMAANLLLAGDATLLERLFDLATRDETDLFAFALAAAVPALPVWQIFNVRANEPVPFSDAPERPALARLRRWWSENGRNLRYDPASRTFVLP